MINFNRNCLRSLIKGLNPSGVSGFSQRRDKRKNYVRVICAPSSYLSVGGTGGAVCQPLVIVTRGQCCDRQSVKR